MNYETYYFLCVFRKLWMEGNLLVGLKSHRSKRVFSLCILFISKLTTKIGATDTHKTQDLEESTSIQGSITYDSVPRGP